MLEAYDGSSDPTEHVATFHMQMTFYGTSNAIMCRAFPTTLRGITRGWYSRLPPSSIHSFDQLAREFDGYFLSSARPKPTAASLLGMRQKEEEHLGQYLACFIDEVRVIPDVHPSLVIQAFMIGIKPFRLFWSLVERPPTTVPEMLQRANQYVTVETLVAEKHEDHKRPRLNPLEVHPLGSQGGGWREIREKGLLKTPNPLRSRAKDRDRRRYCRFHYDYGHDTKECYDLKNQIKDLIHCDHLDRYIMKSCEPSLHSKGPVERQIDVIVGGSTVGGISSSARKAYARLEVQKRPRP
ncbi:hypothetical protein BHE74_00026350 [Ensete ventricosum]|nr:hypothetical protein BHE74_00026350 [Ensete ventricosum]RZR90111.1 hypothetical protein BHM03_00017935 [Ensete ventricosum]